MTIQKEIPQDPRDAGKNTFAPVIDIATQTEVQDPVPPPEEAVRDEEDISLLDRRTTIISEKRRKRKSRLLKWGLGITASAAIVGAGVGIVNAVSSNNQIDSNTLPTPVSEPGKLPIIVPVVETPEITIPRSFTTTEESSVKFSPEGRPVGVLEKKGTVREDVNTMPLTTGNLDSIVKDNPDSLSGELYELNKKYIFFPIKSDKNVAFVTTIADREVHDELNNTIRFKGAGGTVFDVHNDDVAQLFVPQAEIFRLPPWIAEGKEYYTKLLLKEILPDGRIKFYEVETYGYARVMDVEIADEFKNAPIIQGDSSHLWSDQKGQPANMIKNEDGTFTAPSLLKLKKEGLRLIIWAFGNTALEFYTAVDKNGDTKAVKPS